MSKLEEKFRKLDDIDHALQRPSMYIGSIKPHTSRKFLYDNGKMFPKIITYNPGLLKIFDEIITNSVDESKRKGSKLDTIKVTINKNRIEIWDNGGIPVVKHKLEDQWIPELVFSNLKAGSNFDDDESRTWAGTNGVGSSLTNIFSKEFIVSTCDGKNSFLQVFSDNMRKRTTPTIKKSKVNHTSITFEPDFQRFGLTELDDDNIEMLKKRVVDISGSNPQLKIFLNNESIDIKSFKDYCEFYTDNFYYESNGVWNLGISHSIDGFQQISFVNSIETYDGGNHVDYILNQIILNLREFFQKKHKTDIKPSEIKNHIRIFISSTVVNPSFSSQTKEKLITEVKDFGSTYEVSDKLIKWVLKSEIVSSILDWIQQKKSADENKLARELNKALSKIKVEKLIDAKSKDRWKCSLSIFEGDSASSAFRKYRDPQYQGAFSLRGKFINALEITNQKLVLNQEVVNLMGALGLKLGQKVVPGTLRYGKILIYTDADQDGNSISALLINFLYKYWPELFESPIVFKTETPIVVGKNLKSKNKLSFYTQGEYSEWLSKINPKDWEIEYKKGLGALTDIEYREIINTPRVTQIISDDLTKSNLNVWFGKDSDLRKNQLLGVEQWIQIS
jgi:DNA topoisomerase-2